MNFLFIKQKKILHDKEILIPVETIEINSPINLSFSSAKKNKGGKVLFVLLSEIGKSEIDIEVPKKTIIES